MQGHFKVLFDGGNYEGHMIGGRIISCDSLHFDHAWDNDGNRHTSCDRRPLRINESGQWTRITLIDKIQACLNNGGGHFVSIT